MLVSQWIGIGRGYIIADDVVILSSNKHGVPSGPNVIHLGVVIGPLELCHVLGLDVL